MKKNSSIFTFILILSTTLCSAADLASPPDYHSPAAEWVGYFNEYANAANAEIRRESIATQKGTSKAPIQVEVVLGNKPQEFVSIGSNDGKSLSIEMSESFLKTLGLHYLKMLLSLKVGRLKNVILPISEADLAVIAFNAKSGDKRAQVLLMDYQQKLFTLGESRINDVSILQKWNELKVILQNKFQTELQLATLEYSRNLNSYLKRISHLDENQLRAQLWKLLIESNRNELAKFFETHLPWELMLSSDKIIWRMWLDQMIDTSPENTVLVYRGEPADFEEKKPTSIDYVYQMLHYKAADRLRLAWPLRKFMSGEVTFNDLFGVPAPGSLEKYKDDYEKTSYLHNLLHRRWTHSTGGTQRKTVESPFISLSPMISGTLKFAAGGYVRAYLVSQKRLNRAEILFASENEVLAPLFLLPDEEIAKVSASSSERLRSVAEKTIADGRVADKNKFFADFHAKNPLDWLGESQSGNFCSKIFGY